MSQQPIYRGLAFRVASLLAFAVLPVGLIAVAQSSRLETEVAKRTEEALLALTSDAARSETMAVTKAHGLLLALRAMIMSGDPRETMCSDIFSEIIAQAPEFSLAAYIDASGVIRCASRGVGRDVSDTPTYQLQAADPDFHVVVSMAPAISQTSVIVLTEPVLKNGAFDGYVAISLPHKGLRTETSATTSDRPLEVMTFNDVGQILSSELGIDSAARRLPRDVDIAGFVGKKPTTFNAISRTGEWRTYAIVPMVEGKIYGMGTWPVQRAGLAVAPPLIFPLLMWTVSLAAAFFAVKRLVIRHIGSLNRAFVAFANSRELVPLDDLAHAPTELREIGASWNDVAQRLLMDEAHLEDALHQKNVLIREVHHRVKNNLQLISSIVNMKVRKASTAEARAALKEVQMRVMSIATVHLALYDTSTQGLVQMADLMRHIVNATVAGLQSPSHEMEFDATYAPVTLYPDQAVPIALLAAECVTNAVKYMGHAPGEKGWLKVSMTNEGGATRLQIRNSKGIPFVPPAQVAGTGLGKTLIEAFARQLGGKVTQTDSDSEYSVTLDFTTAPFTPDDDRPIDLQGD